MPSAVVNLAGIDISIASRYHENIERFFGFFSKGIAKLNISISDERLLEERSLLERFYSGRRITEVEAEFNAIYRDLSSLLFAYGVVPFHGVLIGWNGYGILFTAPSGTGKSTHANFWKEAFPREVSIINGDKPLLRIIDGTLHGFGSPWKGKECIGDNSDIPIKAICHLQRGKNKIISIPNVACALEWLFDAVMIKERERLGVELLRWFQKAFGSVSIYDISCSMNVDSAIMARTGINL